MIKKARYWMVHKENGGAPSKKHESQFDAEVEAKRLSEKYPGDTVFILESINGFCAGKPKVKPVKMVKKGECGSGTCDCLA